MTGKFDGVSRAKFGETAQKAAADLRGNFKKAREQKATEFKLSKATHIVSEAKKEVTSSSPAQ